MASSIKNSKTKDFKKVEEAYKTLMRKTIIESVAKGMRASYGLVLNKINDGYTIEQIKKYCENTIKEIK